MGLAKALGSEVVLCQVLTAPLGVNLSGAKFATEQYISRVANRLRAAGLAVRTDVRSGEAALEIHKAALDYEAEAIVMATRGRRRLEKLMLGSVAEAVVRDSRLPVLLVSRRPAKHTAERAA
jgi:nucleotide-binding universal stress UspA family protein